MRSVPITTTTATRMADAVARRFRLGARVGDELVQCGVDVGAVGAGLGEQCVTDYAVVLSVAVGGLQGCLDIGVHLGADFPDGLRG